MAPSCITMMGRTLIPSNLQRALSMPLILTSHSFMESCLAIFQYIPEPPSDPSVSSTLSSPSGRPPISAYKRYTHCPPLCSLLTSISNCKSTKLCTTNPSKSWKKTSGKSQGPITLFLSYVCIKTRGTPTPHMPCTSMVLRTSSSSPIRKVLSRSCRCS